jgi:hypothetical protein
MTSMPDLTDCVGRRTGARVEQRTADHRADGDDHAAAKAHSLLACRGVSAMARRVLDVDSLAEWSSYAHRIQAAIYRLDFHYESTMAIRWHDEAPLWEEVERALADGAGGSSDPWACLDALRRYADAERRIHEFDVIDRREFDGILVQKCADVRIARSLVWAFVPTACSTSELAFWSVYDQCWEIIEDLADLHEDGRDWNLNFWLYGPMAGVDPMGTIAAVRELLVRRLASLEQVVNQVPATAAGGCAAAFRRTRSVVRGLGSPERRVLRAVMSGQVTSYGCLSSHAESLHGAFGARVRDSVAWWR